MGRVPCSDAHARCVVQTALVFGHGNVAIDIARMLVSPIDVYARLSALALCTALVSWMLHVHCGIP